MMDCVPFNCEQKKNPSLKLLYPGIFVLAMSKATNTKEEELCGYVIWGMHLPKSLDSSAELWDLVQSTSEDKWHHCYFLGQLTSL